jgi:hypothetical protein
MVAPSGSSGRSPVAVRALSTGRGDATDAFDSPRDLGTAAVIAALGIAAAVVNGLGFWLYARRVVAGDIQPNGVSWLMRSYGTLVLFLIWTGVGVPSALMLHSVVSGVAAVGIAAFALSRGLLLRPQRQDYAVLACDVGLMATYLGLVQTGLHASMATAVLGITATRKLAPYWPILRTTYQLPRREKPLAWIVWAIGYAILGIAAVAAGLAILLAYAVAMVGIHLTLAGLAFRAAASSSAGDALVEPVRPHRLDLSRSAAASGPMPNDATGSR